MQTSTLRGHMPALDGVRAFAALAVIVMHTVRGWLPGGYVGVDVFFVLSGFLITGLLLSEVERTRTVDIPRFYVRRALRLLPALALLCVVQAVVFLVLPTISLRGPNLLGLGTAATYTSSFFAAAGHDLGEFMHTWSLSDEEVFYLVWPMALLLFRRLGRLRALVLGTTAAAIVWHVGAAVAGAGVDRLYYPPDMRAEQLLIGCSLAALLHGSGRVVPSWVGALGAAVLVGYGFAAGHISLHGYLAGGTEVIALASACLIGALATSPDSLLARPFAGRVQLWLGKRSYGLYIWHPLAVFLVLTYGPGQAVLRLPLVILLGVALAAASYRFVELPFLRMKNAYPARRVRVEVPVGLAQEA